MLLPRTRCMFPASSQHKLYLADFSNLSFTFTCHRFSFVIRSVLHMLKLFPIGKLHTSGRTTWSCNGILNSSQMEMLNVYIVVSMHIQKYDLTLFDSKLTFKKNETTKIKFKQMLSSNQNQEENQTTQQFYSCKCLKCIFSILSLFHYNCTYRMCIIGI